MDTTYTPFCSEIPFLRALRRPFGSAAALLCPLFLLTATACIAVALPPLYWLQFLTLPCLLACPLLLGLFGHAKGRKPLRGCAFGWLWALALLLLVVLLAGIAGLWLPIPLWHGLCADFIAGLGLPAAAVAVAPSAFATFGALTLLVACVFCQSTVKSIRFGQASIKGAAFLGVLLLLWAVAALVGGGLASVFYTPQSRLLPLPLPLNLFLALAAAFTAAALILFAVVLFRVSGTQKKFAKF